MAAQHQPRETSYAFYAGDGAVETVTGLDAWPASVTVQLSPESAADLIVELGAALANLFADRAQPDHIDQPITISLLGRMEIDGREPQ